ncbi:MAG: TonB-dependent receptor [Chitinophagaceae bacterium]
MKKIIIPGLILLFFPLFIFAQNRPGLKKISISGLIKDTISGKPLPGTSIYVADDKLGTVADPDGRYRIENIPAGHHILEISHTGYSTRVEHIELATDAEIDFSLSPVITENQGVIVTGVAAATSIRKTPVPVTALRKQALLQTSATNIIDALSHVPGVSQLSTGPAISKPVIRGLGYNRVVTVNDGVRQEGQQWGDEHGIEIDEMSVNRVEILKGPASLMYGSDALAGVVHFISANPVADGTLRGNMLMNYQSNGGLLGFNSSLAGNHNGFNWNMNGTYRSSGDYRNKYDGKVLNSRFNERNFSGYAGINKSWGYSHLIFSHFNQRAGMVEGERDDNTGMFLLYAGTPLERIATGSDLDARSLFVPYQHIRHTRVISDNNFVIRKSRLRVNLGWQSNIRQEFGNPEDPAEKDLYFDLSTFTYNLQWQIPEMKEWHTTFGVGGMMQNNTNRGNEVLIPEYQLTDLGGFIITQRFFKKATFSGGLRFDNRSVNSKSFFEGQEEKFPAFRRSFSNISGSAGISLEATERITVKLNMARGFRAPTLAELASNGAHEGTNRFEYGDRDLRSETSFQFDAGLDLNYEHFSFGFSAFYNRVNNFIFYRKLESVYGGDSLIQVDGQDLMTFRFNQQDATLKGIEATLDIHPHPLDWLHFENSFSYVRGKLGNLVDGSRNLPLIPGARWVSELKGDLKEIGKHFRNFYFMLEADHTFNQDKPFTGFDTETSTPGFTLFNAGAGADVVNDRKRILFSLHLSLNNITNTAWQSHLSRLKYTAVNRVTGRAGVFNTGRNFSVKLNVPLNFSREATR